MSSLQRRFAEHFKQHVVPRLSVRIAAAAASVKLGFVDYDDVSTGLRRFCWRRGAGRLPDEMQEYLFVWLQSELCGAIDKPTPPMTVEVWNLVVWQWAFHQERGGEFSAADLPEWVDG